MKTKWGIYIAVSFFILLLASSCTQNNNGKPSDERIAEGKKLAELNCQSCHLLPNPNWVDAKTWEAGVMPAMGPRFGIFEYKGKRYNYSKYDLSLPSGYYPSKPTLTDDQWQKIIDYYVTMAQKKNESKQVRQYPIKNELPLFNAIVPDLKLGVPSTSFVKIDETSKDFPFIVSDVIKHEIYRYNKDLKQVDSTITRGPVVNIEMKQNEWFTCDIGMLNPNNDKLGSGRKIGIGTDGKMQQTFVQPLISQLQRPVQLTTVDLNKDGKDDILACEFGFLTGQLSWMENKGGGKYEKHILRPLPGAMKTIIEDYNHDGLPDIWVLIAQGDEGIFLYTNQGNGKFVESRVLRFPSINGSSSFDMVDMNNDGFKDIIYTCGDNADYSLVLKPYHGVYIFLNDGKNQFTQKYFYPLNGCYKAIARDFDNDGDLDIATISYFADYQNQPEEGFVYLRNDGNFDFKPFSLPITQKGRWLTMDAGDYDHDGKIDLILGNFSVAPSFIKSKVDWKKGPIFMVLKNTGIR
ncbi:MAG: FG-GAP-like repeat-containing protein [Bacteroidota bacterium]